MASHDGDELEAVSAFYSFSFSFSGLLLFVQFSQVISVKCSMFSYVFDWVAFSQMVVLRFGKSAVSSSLPAQLSIQLC